MSEPRHFPDGYHMLPPGKLANAVTWLEMRAAPAAPLAEPLALRRVVDPDLGWYRRLFDAIGRDWLWSGALEAGDAALAERLAQPTLRVHTAHDDAGAEIGLVELDAASPKEIEISYFGLVPAATGRGLGKRAMAAALAEAWAPGVERVWLHTCNFDHPGALRFYRGCGFVPYAVGFEIMDDPRATGVLPREAAPHVPFIAP